MASPAPITYNNPGGGTVIATQNPSTGQPQYQVNLPSGLTLGPISQADLTSGNSSESYAGTPGAETRGLINFGNYRSPVVTTASDVAALKTLYTSAKQIATQAAVALQKEDKTAAPAPAPAPAPKTTTKPATTTATSTPVIKTVTPVPVVTPFVVPAPRVLGATITNPLAPPAPAYQLAISNPVPNPVLKPPTDASIKSLITPTPTVKVVQPALIPAPKVVAPTITNPFAKTTPDPNAIVNAVPNPKLNTKPLTPKESTALSLASAKPVTTITAGTPALIPAVNKDQIVKVPIVTASQPKLVVAPVVKGEKIVNTTPTSIKPVTTTKGAPLPLSTFAFTPPTSPASGVTGAKAATVVKPTQQDQANFEARKDWRVRLALAPDGPTTKYLYRAASPGTILEPLKATDGVVFPYTPNISVAYAASYESISPVHSNYKINQYTNSSVDSVSITCDFTAQDAFEARYLLAVIHFFRSMTKMFYGQDTMPKNGTPPPLCYLFGLGEFQFSALPLAITGFTYSLPNDVDYIKTTAATTAGSPQPAIKDAANTPNRLGAKIKAGGKPNPPSYGATPSSAGVSTTYVPTKIQLAITCLPMMSRNMVSNKFSLQEYANGNLLKGTVNPGGGMW